MKRLVATVGIVIFAMWTFAMSAEGTACCQIELRDEQLWDMAFRKYLDDPLWVERDAYDAGHFLMLPLHAAFSFEKADWMEAFSDHIYRFLSQGRSDYEEIGNHLIKLHYLYFLSRYLVLAESIDKPYLVPVGLVDFVYRELEEIWHKPAWQWDREPFPEGMKERLLWKLDTEDVPWSYYRAIIDEELFTFAIAADLASLDLDVDKFSILPEILEIAYRVFEQEGVFQEHGGWLLQPGVWTDAPSYAYAGHDLVAPGLEKKPVEGIAWDVSHSQRMPLWLNSYLNTYPEGSKEHELYSKIKSALAKQFHDVVLVPPTEDFGAYRTFNFMDGRNGLYGYRYTPTEGVIVVHGPWDLSGSILIGWWAFLDSGREWEVYDYISRSFPLPQEVVELYIDENTKRDRNPLIQGTAQYTTGMLELITRLAAKIAVKPWDTDRNGVTDIVDLTNVVANFGQEVSLDDIPNPDANQDGIVDILDLIMVSRHLEVGDY
ncbi:hypothetical protein ACFL6S_25820 [Candidatus Poribacteria bacterium]